MIKYTKKEIKKEWEEISKEPNLIYRNGEKIFNYKGSLKDELDTYYFEYISKLMLDDFKTIKSIGKDTEKIRKDNSFNMDHDGISDTTKRLKKYDCIKFDEKTFAIALFNSECRFSFGKIFDYEIPLKDKKQSYVGKVDLLSKKNKEVNVIELKIRHCYKGETLLRAIVEAFTFTKILNNRKEKLIEDYKLEQDITLRPVILTMSDSFCSKNMEGLEKGEISYQKKLIIKMNEHLDDVGVLPFRFYSIKCEEPCLEQNDEGKIKFKEPSFVESKIVEYAY
ncbi:MAG: hypothetical protein ACOC5T_02015 [Elusimicrobiota bacterium]